MVMCRMSRPAAHAMLRCAVHLHPHLHLFFITVLSMSLSLLGSRESLTALQSVLDGGELLTRSGSLRFGRQGNGDGDGRGDGDGDGVSAVNRHGDLFVLGADRTIRFARLRDIKVKKKEIVKV